MQVSVRFSICIAIAVGPWTNVVAQRVPVRAPTEAVTEFVRWVAQTGDNGMQPFAVIDKKVATLYVFDGRHSLQAVSAVLLGATKGDDSAPDVGKRAIEDIEPHERTTPSGRFVTEPGINLQGERIVWVDYDTGISMHSVRSSKPAERRLQRLNSLDPGDNRISYGCINVPAAFFRKAVQPVFGRYRALVYVLPETRSVATLMKRKPEILH
jgi:hypothetical protein